MQRRTAANTHRPNPCSPRRIDTKTDPTDDPGSTGTVADDRPTLGRVYRHRAFARLRLGDYDQALADLSMLESLSGMDDELRLVAAWMSVRMRRWEEAKQYLRPLPTLSRQHVVDALTGYVEYHEGRWHESASAFKRAAAADHPDAELALAHGLVAYDIGDFDTSIDVWETACSRNPRDLRVPITYATC